MSRQLPLIRVALLATICLVCTSLAAPAHAAGPSLGGGLRLGVTGSHFTGDDVDGSRVRTGVGVALFGEIVALPFFALQTELAYHERGEIRDYSVFGESGSIETRLRYLDIPLLARLQLPSPVSPYVVAGPYVSFLLDADTIGDDVSRDVTNRMNRTDVGLAVGPGLVIDAKVVSVHIEARYSRGFRPVINAGSAFGFERTDPDVRNESFLVSAGVGF